MSWLSGLFSEKKVEQTPDKEPWQLAAGQNIAKWASKYLNNYIPGKAYDNQFTAPMTGYEQKGLEWLNQYLAPGNQYEQLAGDEIKKTLTGGYDPYTSDFYKSVRTGAGYNVQDEIDAMRRGQGARGTYFQDTSAREENKVRMRSINYLNEILGNLAQSERNLRFQATDKALAMSRLPAEKAQVGLTLGSVPRIIENEDLEKKYQDFLRQQQELSGVIGAGQNVFGTNINYGVKDYSAPSPFERIMKVVAPLTGQIIGAMSGVPIPTGNTQMPVQSMTGHSL